MAKKDYTISDFIGGLVFLVVAFIVANPVLSIVIVVSIIVIWFGGAELWKNKINPRKYKQSVWKQDNNKNQGTKIIEERIENQTVKNFEIEKVIDNRPINIQTCSKDEILSLIGFDEEMANKFIECRKNGKVWYNIDSFAMEFNLQPHEIILIQERVIFPIKANAKLGKRRIDL